MNSLVSDNKNVPSAKEKEYKKFISFGSLYITESTFSSNEDNFIQQLQNHINCIFKNNNKYIVDTIYDAKQEKTISRDEKLEFTKLNADNEHFFGTFTRISNSKDVLTNIVDNTSNEKIDPSSIYFEYNTLFYIDYKNKAISFIKTEHIRNVYPFLEAFLNNNNFLNIKIAPLIKPDEEIKQSIITQVDIVCARTEINPNTDFVSLNNLEKMGCTVKNYKLSVSLGAVKNNFASSLLNFHHKHKENIKKMSISTLNEDIDLLTNHYTKTVPIKLHNNYEEDYNTIELTLRYELLKAVQ